MTAPTAPRAVSGIRTAPGAVSAFVRPGGRVREKKVDLGLDRA